jgi:hypothetical protein
MKLLIILCLILIPLSSYPQVIDQITDYVLNRVVVDTDQHSGSINRTNERLFVSAVSKIEEYHIYEDGSLERLYYYETGMCSTSPVIDDDFFFSFYQILNAHYMTIHDLSYTPMRHIATVEVPIVHQIGIPQSIDEYILISDRSLTLRFNKLTMNFDRQYDNIAGLTVFNSLLVQSNIQTISNQFYDYYFSFFTFCPENTINPLNNHIFDLYLEIDRFRGR